MLVVIITPKSWHSTIGEAKNQRFDLCLEPAGDCRTDWQLTFRSRDVVFCVAGFALAQSSLVQGFLFDSIRRGVGAGGIGKAAAADFSTVAGTADRLAKRNNLRWSSRGNNGWFISAFFE